MIYFITKVITANTQLHSHHYSHLTEHSLLSFLPL